MYKIGTYDLFPAHRLKASKLLTPEYENWRPNSDLPLEEALPAPWDTLYSHEFKQPFQPVKFWRNANIIADYLETRPAYKDKTQALAILDALLTRLSEFTVVEDEKAWVESRFVFANGRVPTANPWVSGIANAFAIFGLIRSMAAFRKPARSKQLKALVRSYANAYRLPCIEGQTPPDRWISFVTNDRHLWFEEYPLPDGEPTLVLNGHIFATLALNEAHGLWPEDGFDKLVQAGSLTVAGNFRSFDRKLRKPLYSLRGPRKSDYLPIRTQRQQADLFLLTGDLRFMRNSISTTVNIAQHVDPEQLRLSALRNAGYFQRRIEYDARQRNSPIGMSKVVIAELRRSKAADRLRILLKKGRARGS
jgi:ribosomal protein S30